MELPAEILTGVGVSVSGAIGGLWVYLKKRMDKLEERVEQLQKENATLDRLNAILETEKRLTRTHKPNPEKLQKIMQEIEEYEKEQRT